MLRATELRSVSFRPGPGRSLWNTGRCVRVRLAAVCLGAIGLALLAGCRQAGPGAAVGQRSPEATMTSAEYERWARAEFRRQHPGERPLNWGIAEAARRFYRTKPMGRFVLSVEPGKWGNDCSDFAECAVDEGLGAKARFRRGSQRHLLAEIPELWDCLKWRPGEPVQPGDLIYLAHSPYYAPYPGACGHVGVAGPDGMVYDFTKLRSWPGARYGCHAFQWFVRNSLGAAEVEIWRLAAKYRYELEPLPAPRPHPAG